MGPYLCLIGRRGGGGGGGDRFLFKAGRLLIFSAFRMGAYSNKYSPGEAHLPR